MSRSTPLERHRWLDPWRSARGPALRQLVGTIAAALDDYEVANGLRARKRKPADHWHHLVAVDCVVSNLAHSVLIPPEAGQLAVLTGNGARRSARYDNPALGKPLRTLLGRMEKLGLLDWRQSPQRGRASSLAPTEAFVQSVVEAGITPADFGRIDGEEVVLLARISVDYRKDRRTRHSERVGYTDTAETIAMRADMQALNAFLAEADIAFLDDGNGPIDSHDRRLRRHFVIAEDDPLTQRFDRSGRLYGGFWQNLKRARRANIRIEGERISTLDYSAMFPRLAYAAAGVQPPTDDPYSVPGLEGHRCAVKLATNTLFFDQTRHRKSWPQAEDVDGDMPPEWGVGRFRKALLVRHPSLKGSLGVGLGFRLMNTESRIMAGVLMALKAEGVVALPLHDGVMVKMSSAAEVSVIMGKIAREITSFDLPVA